MSTSATRMLLAATTEFLCRHAPFDRMEPEALSFLAERLKLAYYPKDTQIVTPEMGVVSTFYILQRGKVLARQSGDLNVVDYSTMTIGAGECFPIGSVTAQRPSPTFPVLPVLFRFLSRLPLPLLHNLGALAGWLMK